MTVSPTDHRYLQVARTLRKEIVDAVAGLDDIDAADLAAVLERVTKGD